jgi:Icc-related predicted phosphoesterase
MGNKQNREEDCTATEWMRKEIKFLNKSLSTRKSVKKKALSLDSRSSSSNSVSGDSICYTDTNTDTNNTSKSDNDTGSCYPTIEIGHMVPDLTTTVTFLVLSDTHNQHRKLPLPHNGADVLLHCGDWSNWKTSSKNTEDFNKWLGELGSTFKRKIVVGGNHELCCSKLSVDRVRKELITNAEYYTTGSQNITHESGLKIFLSPSTLSRNLTYRANAFAKTSDLLREEFDQCPVDVDILVTHSPPYGILDRHKKGHRMGSMVLWDTVRRVLPTVHVFGHCHDNGGAESRNILPAGEWNCKECTLKNKSSHLACSACGIERVPTNVTFINASNKLNVQPFLLAIFMKDGKIHYTTKEEQIQDTAGGSGASSGGNGEQKVGSDVDTSERHCSTLGEMSI